MWQCLLLAQNWEKNEILMILTIKICRILLRKSDLIEIMDKKTKVTKTSCYLNTKLVDKASLS